MGHGSLAGRVDLFCGGLSFRRVAAVDYDAAAFGEKSPRHLLADARVSTCDDRNFPFKPHVALLDTLGDPYHNYLSLDQDLSCYCHAWIGFLNALFYGPALYRRTGRDVNSFSA